MRPCNCGLAVLAAHHESLVRTIITRKRLSADLTLQRTLNIQVAHAGRRRMSTIRAATSSTLHERGKPGIGGPLPIEW